MKKGLAAAAFLGLAWAANPVQLTPENDLAAAIAEAEPGEVLVLAPGIYNLPESLIIDSSLALSGAGSGKTEIVSGASEYLLKVIGTDTDLELTGLSLSHTGREWADVLVLSEGKSTISDVKFAGALSNLEEQRADPSSPNRGGRGLVIAGKASSQLDGIVATDNDLFGIAVEDQAQVSLSRSTLQENGSSGIIFSDYSGGELLNNVFEDHPLHGVIVSGNSAPIIEGNTLRGNDRLGILYDQNSGGTARNNLSEGNAIGIAVSGKSTPLLEGNTLRDNGLSGIFYNDEAAGIARGNTSELNRSRGISVAGNANPMIEDNFISGNLDLAIFFSENSTAKVSGNRCEKNGNLDFFVVAPADPELLKNGCEVLVAPSAQ